MWKLTLGYYNNTIFPQWVSEFSEDHGLACIKSGIKLQRSLELLENSLLFDHSI
jgi:hypothetical protein